MKTHFIPKALFIVLIFGLWACYSVEFFPEPDYPNLRRAHIEKVEITSFRPPKPFHKLGTLVFRDFTGDIRDESFIRKIESEAEKRGAEGAWIAYRALRRHTAYQTAARDRHRGQTMPTGSMGGSVGIVKVILFNHVRQQKKTKETKEETKETKAEKSNRRQKTE